MNGVEDIAIPPIQACMECGVSIGRKWRPGICSDCRKLLKKETEPGWTRKYRNPQK